MMSVSLQATPEGSLQLGTPRQITEFETRSILPQNNIFQYSPHRDGKQFLVYIDASDVTPALNVITNWQQLITHR